MYSTNTQKDLNCSHNLDNYFNHGWIKDDYCNNCLDLIADIETQKSINQ